MLRDFLRGEGIEIGHLAVRTMMKRMAIEAITVTAIRPTDHARSTFFPSMSRGLKTYFAPKPKAQAASYRRNMVGPEPSSVVCPIMCSHSRMPFSGLCCWRKRAS